MKLIEKQADGYSAEIQNDIVSITLHGKTKRMNCTYFRPFAEAGIPEYGMNKIRLQLPDLGGLWGYAGDGPIRLRDIGDACKIVSARRDEINAETAAKRAIAEAAHTKRAETAATKAAAELGGLVEQIIIRYYDGYPTEMMIRGIKVDLMSNYKKTKEIDNFVYILTTDADAATTAANDKAAAVEQKETAAKRAEADRRAGLIATAKITGQRQRLRTYTSAECLDNLPDCSFDNVTIWIDGEGRETQTHVHCF